MRAPLFKTLLLFLLIAVSVCPALAADLEFSGTVDFEDVGSYLTLDFFVPAGTTRIDVSYGYSPGGTAAGLTDDVIDIGVYDPDAYRGWSGSNKKAFSIAESAEQTTDSYIPGPLPEGDWQVELGIAWVSLGGTLDWFVNIDLSDEPVGPVFEPQDFQPVVLSSQARWYKGDLHCHSTHSDGSGAMAQVFDYAHGIGLDFIALSDHNAISHMLYLPDHQENYDDLLLIRACEITTYRGHFNVFNLNAYVDYHGTAPGYDINAVIDHVHTLGGYVSPNHPLQPIVPLPGSLYGWGFGFPETDWNKLDFIEAINGPSEVFGFLPNPLNLLAIEWWDWLQDRGFSVTIRGGSDDHKAGQGSGDFYSPIGAPTTMVYAPELSEAGILEAIAQGHAFIMTMGPDGPEVYLTANSGKETAIVGDRISGEQIQVEATVINGKGTTLTLLSNGKPLPAYTDLPVESDDQTFGLSWSPVTESRLRVEVHDGAILQAITNSLYLAPPPSDDDDDDTIDDDDNDDDVGAPDDDGETGLRNQKEKESKLENTTCCGS